MANNQNFELYNNMIATSYIYENSINILDLKPFKNKSLGENGENLTITTLSLNRTSLTIRLMNSLAQCIPNFKGEFLIIDNGSELHEIEKLENVMKKMQYKNCMIKLKKNYGVAGGRNEAMKYIETDWVMFLDNDIYFISNPLEQIQKAILQLGCDFLNLPILDKTDSNILMLGGYLQFYMENSRPFVRARSAYHQIKFNQNCNIEPFLSTYLMGGAAVINKDSFLSLGGFDEAMVIGYEDIDLSIRLLQNGMKIGNCGSFSLIHNHSEPSNYEEIKYEKLRLSAQILKDSADYFEKKHVSYYKCLSCP